MISQNLAPIWLPHWPACTCTISLMATVVGLVVEDEEKLIQWFELADVYCLNNLNFSFSVIYIFCSLVLTKAVREDRQQKPDLSIMA